MSNESKETPDLVEIERGIVTELSAKVIRLHTFVSRRSGDIIPKPVLYHLDKFSKAEFSFVDMGTAQITDVVQEVGCEGCSFSRFTYNHSNTTLSVTLFERPDGLPSSCEVCYEAGQPQDSGYVNSKVAIGPSVEHIGSNI